MRRGRHAKELKLMPEERTILECWARCRETAPARAERARIIIECSRGDSNRSVASELEVTPQTVSKWRGRFLKDRILGLCEGLRIGDGLGIRHEEMARVERLVTIEQPPPGKPWSTRLVAEHTGYSQSKISRIVRACALLPDEWKAASLSQNGFPRRRVRGIAGILFNPPEHLLALEVSADQDGQAGIAAARHRLLSGTEPDPGVRSSGAELGIVASLERRAMLVGSTRRGLGVQRLTDFVAEVRECVPAEHEAHLLFSDGRHSTAPSLENRLSRFHRVTLHVVPPGISWFGLLSAWLAHLVPGRPINGAAPVEGDLSDAIQEYLALETSTVAAFRWRRGSNGTKASAHAVTS